MRDRVTDNPGAQHSACHTGLRMKDHALLAAMLLSVATLPACVEPRFATLTIHKDSKSMVRLYALTDSRESGGFSHPVDVHEGLLSRILEGVTIERSSLFSTSTWRHRAFDEAQISFFAPLLAEGLSQATSDEVVAFLGVTVVSETDWRMTSGAVFVLDQEFFVLLSNHQQRFSHRLSIDEFFHRYQLQPMVPDWAWGDELHFEPEKYAGSADERRIDKLTPEDTLFTGVRFRELARRDSLDQPEEGK